MKKILKKRRTLQETMNFMAAMSAGIELMIGRGANGMSMSAGRDLGRKFSEKANVPTKMSKRLFQIFQSCANT